MKLEELKRRIDSGEIDTVIVAAPDVSGKLVGKRFTGRMFIDTVAEAWHARLQLPADGGHRDGAADWFPTRELGEGFRRF